jgi:hypothetical protein
VQTAGFRAKGITVSWQAPEAVIGRADLDDESRMVLFADPAALVDYELADKEVTAIKSIDAERLDACASILRR